MRVFKISAVQVRLLTVGRQDYYCNRVYLHERQGIGRRNAVCGMGRAVCGVRAWRHEGVAA